MEKGKERSPKEEVRENSMDSSVDGKREQNKFHSNLYMMLIDSSSPYH